MFLVASTMFNVILVFLLGEMRGRRKQCSYRDIREEKVPGE